MLHEVDQFCRDLLVPVADLGNAELYLEENMGMSAFPTHMQIVSREMMQLSEGSCLHSVRAQVVRAVSFR